MQPINKLVMHPYNGTFDTVFNHYMKARFAKHHDTKPLLNE